MKILTAVMMAALTLGAYGETLHVTGVRNWQPTDAAPVSRAFRVQVITGTIGASKYTAQQLLSWGVTPLQPGQDYEVVKTDARSMTVITHDKKGRADKERLDITGVEQ